GSGSRDRVVNAAAIDTRGVSTDRRIADREGCAGTFVVDAAAVAAAGSVAGDRGIAEAERVPASGNVVDTATVRSGRRVAGERRTADRDRPGGSGDVESAASAAAAGVDVVQELAVGDRQRTTACARKTHSAAALARLAVLDRHARDREVSIRNE